MRLCSCEISCFKFNIATCGNTHIKWRSLEALATFTCSENLHPPAAAASYYEGVTSCISSAACLELCLLSAEEQLNLGQRS